MDNTNEWLTQIKRLLNNSPYGHTETSWFYPGDILPNSNRLKYRCRVLAEKGLLEVEKAWQGSNLYRIKSEVTDG